MGDWVSSPQEVVLLRGVDEICAPRRVLLLSDERMEDHIASHGHPERPQRLQAIERKLLAAPIEGIIRGRPGPAPRHAVERVHGSAHIDHIESVRGKTTWLDGDTGVSPASTDAAWLAAGAAIEVVDALCDARADRAFAFVRPPGHHAESSRAMGFCFFNNIAIAARHAIAERGVERVLIVDWDVHHGNGTQHAFYGDDQILVFNAHRFPYYPGTGAVEQDGIGRGEGFNVNVPLPGGLGDGDYGAIFRDLLVPVAETFNPDLVLVSAGYDAHRDEPLADMMVSHEGFAAICAIVTGIADRCAGGRIGLCLEGGYDLDGLARSVHASIQVLSGASAEISSPATPRGEAAIGRVRDHHAHRWPVQ